MSDEALNPPGADMVYNTSEIGDLLPDHLRHWATIDPREWNRERRREAIRDNEEIPPEEVLLIVGRFWALRWHNHGREVPNDLKKFFVD